MGQVARREKAQALMDHARTSLASLTSSEDSETSGLTPSETTRTTTPVGEAGTGRGKSQSGVSAGE